VVIESSFRLCRIHRLSRANAYRDRKGPSKPNIWNDPHTPGPPPNR